MAPATLKKHRVSYANRRANVDRAWFNCWGATLFVVGAADRLEWTEQHKMAAWLASSTAPIYRPRKPGDIAVFTRWGLEHTATYIGNGKYFHKRGMNSAEITDLAGVRKIYHGRVTYVRKLV